MIPSMWAEYETNICRTFWVMVSHQKCWWMDRQTEKAITIRLLHSNERIAYTFCLWNTIVLYSTDQWEKETRHRWVLCLITWTVTQTHNNCLKDLQYVQIKCFKELTRLNCCWCGNRIAKKLLLSWNSQESDMYEKQVVIYSSNENWFDHFKNLRHFIQNM